MRCVGAIITDPAGNLLLVRRGHPPGQGLWSLPGGRVEPGESDDEALRRELLEETGLTVIPGELAGTATIPPYEIYDYYATATGDLHPGDDASDARWAAPSDLVRLPLTDGLREFLNAHLK